MCSHQEKSPLLVRHPDNPLIHPDQFDDVMQLFNPSPAEYNGKTILLVSVKKFGAENGGDTYVAESDDGLNFTIRPEPFIKLDRNAYPFNVLNHHIIDSRITKIDSTYYILTPVMSKIFDSPCTLLGKTMDFDNYEPLEIITQPRNRGASLFPEKINGLYYKLDRPGGGVGSPCGIWLSSSPDLINWGRFRPVLAPGYETWNNSKIGPTPPIKTPEGWLVITHGVHIPAGGCKYYIGAILLDLEAPWEVTGKTRRFLLEAREPYEVIGVCSNTVFPCGALANLEKDEIKLYYGGADTCICLATGKISNIINECKK